MEVDETVVSRKQVGGERVRCYGLTEQLFAQRNGMSPIGRAENPELLLITEFHQLWLDYRIPLNTPYTVARIIELADANAPSKFNPAALRDFLLRMSYR